MKILAIIIFNKFIFITFIFLNISLQNTTLTIIAVISVIVGIGYALWYDRKLKKRFGKKQGGEK